MVRQERVGGVDLLPNKERSLLDWYDWTTVGIIKQTYGVTYNKMEDAKITEKLDLPVFMNQNREVVEG